MLYVPMEGHNSQDENSSKFPQELPLFPPSEPHHSNSVTNPQNTSGGDGGPLPNRRPRGRPRGSKNRPKAPILVTRDNPNALLAFVFKVSAGADVIETLKNFAEERGRGVCVLTGKGMVSNVIIRQPMSSSGSVCTLQGAFEILSITGTVLPSPAPPGFDGLSIFLSGGHGQVLGGNVVGSLIATGEVILTVGSFAYAVLEDNEEVAQGDAENGVNQEQHVEPGTSQTGTVDAGLPLLDAAPINRAFFGDFSRDGSNAAAPGRPF